MGEKTNSSGNSGWGERLIAPSFLFILVAAKVNQISQDQGCNNVLSCSKAVKIVLQKEK